MKTQKNNGADVRDEQSTTAVQLPKYVKGMPRQYRFDAKEGNFNIDGDTKLRGNSFTFKPIAYRIFADDILQMGVKKWVEFFFVDDKGCVSAILFHGYSLENLLKLNSRLFYTDITLDKVELTATAKAHTKKLSDGKTTTYYVAEFTYEPLNDKDIQQIEDTVRLLNEKELYIYRNDTLTGDAEITLSHNFYNIYEQDAQLAEPAQDTPAEEVNTDQAAA